VSNLIYKKFVVVPHGVIQSGFLNYSLDGEKGIIVYDGSVRVSALFFSKDYPLKGPYKVDPDMLRSSNVKEGQKFDFGPFKIAVTDVANGHASADIVIDELGISGRAEFDLSGEFVSLSFLEGHGTVYGFDLLLELTPA
jgi:hypothetical protein